MVAILSLLEANPTACIAYASNFWGLGKTGFITTVIISVIVITTVAWLINGTKRRD